VASYSNNDHFSRELVACDPTGLTTLAIPLQPDQGVLLLGTLVVLDGSRALLPGHAAGVLSMTVDTDGMPPDRLTQFTRGADFRGEPLLRQIPGCCLTSCQSQGLRPAESISKPSSVGTREMDQSALLGS
jgi:hypothetical protein